MASDKLLIICGPTAVGKTKLALQLAKRFGGELANADSRQAYRGVDVVSGKDLPKKFKIQNSKFKIKFKDNTYLLKTYIINKIPVWLYDIVSPQEEFSVAHWRAATLAVIRDIWGRGKLPILVGGTGLYLLSLVEPPATLNIAPQKLLRKRLNKLAVTQLALQLKTLDPARWSQMNASDRANPRRLVRAIEVALWRKEHPESLAPASISPDSLWIGLTAEMKELRERIAARVNQRFPKAVTEVKRLQKLKLSPQVLTTLGFGAVSQYLAGELSRKEALKGWTGEEVAYAKRQLTWFKKQTQIHWFDISLPAYPRPVEKLVSSWYTRG